MMLYGMGDGGGGPLPEHIARLSRMRDVAGLPRVHMQTPRAAFEALRAEIKDPLVWVGELYFELHRGTYTTQAATKRGNRRSEEALREAEMWSALAHALHGRPYPAPELTRLWQLLLLCAFLARVFSHSLISCSAAPRSTTYCRVLPLVQSMRTVRATTRT